MYPLSVSPAAAPTQAPPATALAAGDAAEASGFAGNGSGTARRLVTEASQGVAAVSAFGDHLVEALGGAALQTCSEVQHKVCVSPCRRNGKALHVSSYRSKCAAQDVCLSL